MRMLLVAALAASFLATPASALPADTAPGSMLAAVGSDATLVEVAYRHHGGAHRGGFGRGGFRRGGFAGHRRGFYVGGVGYRGRRIYGGIGYGGRRYYGRPGYAGYGVGMGLAAGAVVGGAVAATAAANNAVAYCQRRFRSYDVVSGTYLGYDGLRHRCP